MFPCITILSIGDERSDDTYIHSTNMIISDYIGGRNSLNMVAVCVRRNQ